MVTAVGSPRATSAAKLGPDRIPGSAFGAHSRDHLGHEFVAAGLDALGAGDHRRASADGLRQRLAHRAQSLRRHHQQDRVGARGFRQRARDLDAVVEPHAGQEAALAFARKLLGIAGLLLPQRHAASGARAVSASAVPQAPPPSTEMR